MRSEKDLHIRHVDTYQGVLDEAARYGGQAEELTRQDRTRVLIIVAIVVWTLAGIAYAAWMNGGPASDIWSSVVYALPVAVPLLGYCAVKLALSCRRIAAAQGFQSGQAFEGMSEEEAIAQWNARVDAYEARKKARQEKAK